MITLHSTQSAVERDLFLLRRLSVRTITVSVTSKKNKVHVSSAISKKCALLLVKC